MLFVSVWIIQGNQPVTKTLIFQWYKSSLNNILQKSINKSEVLRSIQNLKLKKAPGYDLITPNVLKELPDVAFRFLTYIFNAILRTSTFPRQWKVAEIHMILKPAKQAELLPILSKIMETLLLKRLCPLIACRKLIPDHQFGFRQYHSTTEQVNSSKSTRKWQFLHCCFSRHQPSFR